MFLQQPRNFLTSMHRSLTLRGRHWLRKRGVRRPRWVTRQLVLSVLVIAALVWLGAHVSAYKASRVSHIKYIGHADEAAYAAMGRSLLAGRGFHTRFISWHFIAYDRDIEKREDHWPPLMGMLIAPFFLFMGQSAPAAKWPAILIGSIGLPLATAWLAMALSRRAWTGLAAGLLMLINVHMFSESLKTLSDILQATLVVAFAAAVVHARYRPQLLIAAGIAGALAYYAKGSEIILLGLLPAAALLACGWRVLARKWLYLGAAIFALLLLPWMISNVRNYGHPLHSTQNFVSGYIGFRDWEEPTYTPYFGRDVPTTSDRWTTYRDRFWPATWRHAERIARWSLLGTRAGESEWAKLGWAGIAAHDRLLPERPLSSGRVQRSRNEPFREPWAARSGAVASLTVVVALVGAAAWCTGVAAWWAVIWLRRWKQSGWRRPRFGGLPRLRWPTRAGCRAGLRSWARDPMPTSGPAWLAQPLLALLLIYLTHAAFLALLWDARDRFAFVFLPPVAAVAAVGLSHIVALPELLPPVARWLRKAYIPTVLTVICCITAVAWAHTNRDKLIGRLEASTNTRHFPFADQSFYPDMGQWMTQHLPPNAVIMTRNPWELRFYLPDEIRAVAVPYARPPELLGVARYYGVTHYLDDRDRPGMWIYTRRDHPAFERIRDAPGRLFKIHWEKLDPKTIVSPLLPRPGQDAYTDGHDR